MILLGLGRLVRPDVRAQALNVLVAVGAVRLGLAELRVAPPGPRNA